MLKAIKAGNYKLAAAHMEWQRPSNHRKGRTPWFNQTGGRAKRLVSRMKAIAPAAIVAPEDKWSVMMKAALPAAK
jgi:hypothetical protein